MIFLPQNKSSKILNILMLACLALGPGLGLGFSVHAAEAAQNTKSKTSTQKQKSQKSNTKKKTTEKKSDLSTDIRFSGQEVGGKYQVPGESVATVEKEKPLIDLIEPRQNFKDRLRKSVSQR